MPLICFLYELSVYVRVLTESFQVMLATTWKLCRFAPIDLLGPGNKI